ncbi:pilus (MSHA type) biogenesis protein MshL [Corallincola luteus]|uniref:Pilus (MSHA type) biogenesis protein MshL n=4 Tax=Psychromonadaceae TaxID=267894 RepID=A0A368NJL7_9GAMM|nr:pilus (MSHA type) biogenesis protein MshL [Corallincola holothuriorum]TAA45234.1 pilus (MSHA type) biogenesis protein MshL [Corallincola spongiicola]TCI03781.1 pilus (MSHA type) biogenesis protein MshL [Corallincola luteus]
MKRSVIAICGLGLLLGCETTPKLAHTEQKQAIKEAIDNNRQNEQADIETTAPPADVMAELMPETQPAAPTLAGEALLQERRFEISADGVPARQFFASLVDDSSYSVAVHPDVVGDITLHLKDVTLAETLDVVTDIYGYDVRRSGKVLNIFPAGMRTETFSLDYLFMTRDGESRTTILTTRLTDDDDSNSNSDSSGGSDSYSDSSGSDSNSQGLSGTLIHTKSQTDYWTELTTILNSLVGDGTGRKVIVSPQSGLVTVHAYPEELRKVSDYLARSEETLQRQVLLEAKIIEVTLNDDFQQGINWERAVSHIGSTDFNFTNTAATLGNELTTNLGGIVNLSFSNSDFSGVISLLSTQGEVNVLSSPRISASNNQKALIKVGTDEYYVTDVSTTTVTGTATSTTPDIELTPFFSGISLDVTPQIDEDGTVLLHVHPSITDVTEENKVIVFGGDTIDLPLAVSDIRETDTVIKAHSGDVVVIGGLMTSLTGYTDSKVPLLGDIPFMGEFFTNKREFSSKAELVILIKPTLLTRESSTKELERSSELLERWYPEPEKEF